MDRALVEENIPRRMKVGVLENIEIRIAREGLANASRDTAPTALAQPAGVITRAMSVRLQGEPGRFYIEPQSPETQWSGSRADQLASDFAVWRFTVIPQVRGPAELMLIVNTRTIGADGVIAESGLPEQAIMVRISGNFTRKLKRWMGWLLVAALGGIIAKLGEGYWAALWTLARNALGL